MFAYIGELVCRSAEEQDYQQVYDLLVDFVCTDRSPSILAMQKSNLQKIIKYYIKNLDCLVVADGDVITAAYLGKGNSILHLVSNNDMRSFVLLTYVVVEQLHDHSKPSIFKLIGPFSKSSYLSRFTTEIRNDGTYVLNNDARTALSKAFTALGGINE